VAGRSFDENVRLGLMICIGAVILAAPVVGVFLLAPLLVLAGLPSGMAPLFLGVMLAEGVAIVAILLLVNIVKPR
jgi:hypothetical protein